MNDKLHTHVYTEVYSEFYSPIWGKSVFVIQVTRMRKRKHSEPPMGLYSNLRLRRLDCGLLFYIKKKFKLGSKGCIIMLNKRRARPGDEHTKHDSTAPPASKCAKRQKIRCASEELLHTNLDLLLSRHIYRRKIPRI